MYQAQMAIEERKRQLNLTARPGIIAQAVISKVSKLNTQEASLFMNYSMEKINRYGDYLLIPPFYEVSLRANDSFSVLKN